MENQFKEIFGAWVAAIGTITSAIGSTPFDFISSNVRKDLNVYGNVLQAVGNALEADGQGEVSLEKIGNEIQSIGNVTVISGLIIDFKEETQIKLVIAGNWTQALGGLTALADEFEDASDKDESLNIIGNLLQSIGNSLQAIGGIDELKSIRNEDQSNKKGNVNNVEKDTDTQVNNETNENEEGKLIDIIGSWVQAVGSVISLIGQIREESEELEGNDE
ncbi:MULTISPECIES: DUF6944 family repetitive protein [Bacillus cereus group]|uniref:DUF6944 family repetitive protein n=1 Tax=Bacillus cereus group TaxID=86661 RepID=UPI000B4428A3|nr:MULTISPECIES: hypothetical protein [Bacillus cereus group]MED3181408.1 hypothetical protein [Bacillus thuringiensis]OTY07680.1 hypothetical protein BK734_21075 [Bacillus thuringiensis serovar kim]OUB20148.1 hypothetical protein BK733_07170 [Bacillus thuringiensis serovar xiaguangiensis]HEE9030866.1 hypothetical protein [Bacillus cereus]HEF1901535.1 hypothetical protein [Bacillus cereus]